MPLLIYLLLLALIQGITEFLPISSSGHLLLLDRIMPLSPDTFSSATGSQEEIKLFLDISVHLGTLTAVLVYSHKDLSVLIRGLGDLLNRKKTQSAKLLMLTLLASFPVFLAGFGLKLFFDYAQGRNSLALIGVSFLLGGIALGVTDRVSNADKKLEDLSYRQGVWTGLCQAFALIPGVSRSGSVIFAGRLFQLERLEAMRFALLTSIPVIGGAALLTLLSSPLSPSPFLLKASLLSAVLSFLAALLFITLTMKWLKSFTLRPFVWYRIIFGLGLLIYVMIA